MRAALRNIACTGLMGLWLTVALWSGVVHPAPYAVVMVLLGGFVACLAAQEASPMAVGAGALGALAHTVLMPLSFATAGAAGLAIAFVPRVVRARSAFGAAAVSALAVTGGGLGAAIAWNYAQASEPLQAAALLVGTLLAAAALFWPIDDPVAFALRSLAARTSGTLRYRLLRGVVLRRRAAAVHGELSRPAARRVRRAWSALVRSARARVDGSHSGSDVLDRRLRTYLAALHRATLAAVRAHELTRDLDDVVLAELELERDDLMARADALGEVR